MEKIRVIIVDDHKLLRDSITVLMDQADDIQVVGSFSSGEELISKAKDVQPDVILMDILLGGMTGIEATRWIKERDETVKVILLSMDVKKELLSAGIQSGIDGYLTKDVEFNILLKGIRTVHRGQKYFPESITRMIFEDFYNKEKNLRNKQDYLDVTDLTKREIEILSLVVTAKTNREIAEALHISVKTVDTHKSHIFDKLGLKNTAELIKYAIRNNLITP